MQPAVQRDSCKPVSVKDMPEFDPDAEVVGVALTVPSWTRSINRIVHSDLGSVSESARLKLLQVLLELQNTIITMINAIREDR